MGPAAAPTTGPFCRGRQCQTPSSSTGLFVPTPAPRWPRFATGSQSFLQSLVDRGKRGVKLVFSDDHGGLKAARQAVFNEASCQRCQFHLMRNAMAHALKVAMRPEIAGNIRRFFEADA